MKKFCTVEAMKARPKDQWDAHLFKFLKVRGKWLFFDHVHTHADMIPREDREHVTAGGTITLTSCVARLESGYSGSLNVHTRAEDTIELEQILGMPLRLSFEGLIPEADIGETLMHMNKALKRLNEEDKKEGEGTGG